MILQHKPNWKSTLHYITQNKIATVALLTVVGYTLIALLAYFDFIASDWNAYIRGAEYLPPSTKHLFGTDFMGRSVFKKIIKGTQVAMSVGLIVALMSLTLGVVLGCLAGYFGGMVDATIIWGCNILDAIPSLILLIAISFIFNGRTLAVYIGLCMTNWVNLCRLIRGEVMRHKEKEYIQAATAIGAGHYRKMFIHIFPNIQHIAIIQFSLIFQIAIKTEVVLSYLGIGIQGLPSWGCMIDQAKSELLRGCWWQLAFATLAMFFIVLALNILSDALRDATDPKLKGK